jgi:hypothetical protein
MTVIKYPYTKIRLQRGEDEVLELEYAPLSGLVMMINGEPVRTIKHWEVMVSALLMNGWEVFNEYRAKDN